VVCGAAPLHSEHALHFDGLASHVEAPLVWIRGVGRALTIEAWFRTTSLSAALVEAYDESSPRRLSLYVAGGSVCIEGVGDMLDPFTLCTTEQAFADGAWHHAAALLKDWSASIFVDGATRAAPTSLGVLTVPDTLTNVNLGYGFVGSGVPMYLAGDLDEVRIWAGPRSERELRDYAATRLPSTPARDSDNLLLGYFALEEEGSANSALDANDKYYLDLHDYIEAAAHPGTLVGFSFAQSPWISPGAF